MAFALREDVSITDADDDVVLFDERAGHFWQLNGTGALALRCLLDGHTPGETARRLSDRYPVDEQTARSDVTDLIARFEEAGLTAS